MRGWWKRKRRTAVNLLLIGLLAGLYFLTATPVAQSAMSRLYGGPVYRGHRKDVVALACAISWEAKALPELLELLNKRNTTITFFVSGDWADENRALLKDMAAAGHEIGTLGQTPSMDGDKKTLLVDISRSVALIRSITGEAPQLYHSLGRKLEPSAYAAKELGLTHVLCTVDLLSARGDAKDVLTRALEKPFGGSIILFEPTGQAVKALPACMDGLKQKGFQITTVSGILE